MNAKQIDLAAKVLIGLITVAILGVAITVGVVKFLAYWRIANGGGQ